MGSATGPVAYGSHLYGGNSYGSGSYGGDLKPASYINGDAGKDADVEPNSSSYRPDQYDRQKSSTAASGQPG